MAEESAKRVRPLGVQQNLHMQPAGHRWSANTDTDTDTDTNSNILTMGKGETFTVRVNKGPRVTWSEYQASLTAQVNNVLEAGFIESSESSQRVRRKFTESSQQVQSKFATSSQQVQTTGSCCARGRPAWHSSE